MIDPADLSPPSRPPTADLHTSLLAEADHLLREADELDVALASVAKLVTPSLADWCIIDLVDGDAPILRRAALAFGNPADAELAEALERYPGRAHDLQPGKAGLTPWTPELIAASAWNAQHRELLVRIAAHSVLWVTLNRRGRQVGVLSLFNARSTRIHGEAELELVQALGVRIASAVHTATLYQTAEAARLRAEAAALRMTRLQSITAAFSEALTAEQVADVVLDRGLIALGARSGALATLDVLHERVDVLKSVEYAPSLAPILQSQPLSASLPLTDAIREGEAIFLTDGHDRFERYPHLGEVVAVNGNGAMVALPLEALGQRLGALAFSFPRPQTFSDEERAFALTLAEQCAQALERARLFEAEREARRTAERTAARIARMQTMTADLATASDLQAVAHAALEHGMEELHANHGCVRMLRPETGELEIVCALGRLPPAAEQRVSLLSSTPESAAGRTREPVWTESATCVPLILEDSRLVGVLALGFRAGQELQTSDKEYCLALAQQTAQSLERARLLDAEREARKREEAARREAEAANALKDQFLATLSHELRTPLTVIVAWSQQVMDRGLSGDLLKRAMSAIERNAKLQTRLVEDLLDVSRIVHGKLVLQRRTLRLREVVQAAVTMVEKRAEVKAVKLQFESGPIDFEIDGDPERLDQVLSNLLSNAVKFTPSGGSVTVRVRQDGELSCVDVTDTGAGIAAEFVPHVFERFRQEDSSNMREHGGLGLGLSIVRHLTELHDGRVSVTSEGKGQGSTFTMHLPVVRVLDA